MTFREQILASSTVSNVAIRVHLQNLEGGGGLDRIVVGIKAVQPTASYKAVAPTAKYKSVLKQQTATARIGAGDTALLSNEKLTAKEG